MDRVFNCDDLSRNIIDFLNDEELFPLKMTNKHFNKLINYEFTSEFFYCSSLEMVKYAIENNINHARVTLPLAPYNSLAFLK